MPARTLASRGSVLVTGASTGIGAACALRLDQLGFRVFVGVRQAEAGRRLKSLTRGALTPISLEVTAAESVAEAARQIAQETAAAGLAGLVNNAGVVVPGPVEFLPLAEWRRQFEVNVLGVVAVTQACLPLLRKGGGRIVNVGSISGELALPFLAPYCASKFALRAVSDSLRLELKPWGLPVSLVEPGAVATPLWEKGRAEDAARAAQWPPEAQELYGPAHAAMAKLAEAAANSALPPEAVADVVVHALTARRPRRRYLVGREARLAAWFLRVVPEGLREALILRRLKGAGS